MNPVAATCCLLVCAAAVFAWALAVSRSGCSPHHNRAFYAGIAGLLAIPVWMASVAGLMLQLFWATLTSMAGVFFVVSSGVLLAGLTICLMAIARLRRNR